MRAIFFQVSGQVIEVKTPLTHRDYSNLISQEDSNHFLVYKTRRCFLYRNQYFQLDIYKDPCHDRCRVSKRLRGFGSKCSASVDFENILNFSISRLIINSSHCYSIRSNLKKMGPLQVCLPVFQGIHRN